MKKWLTFLLLIVITTATVYPCCMEDGCADEWKQETESTECGSCSPFFACGTCVASVVPVFQEIELPEIPHILVKHQSFYILQSGSYSSSPFQPPRIALHNRMDT